jgi:acetate kinase
MDGLDGLVFTGGVGERSPAVRAEVCAGLGFLGIRLDEDLNRELEQDGVATAVASSTAVLVVEAREDLEIARHVRELLG